MKKICMITSSSDLLHDSRIINQATVLSKKYKVTILVKKSKFSFLNNKKIKVKAIDFPQTPIFILNLFLALFCLVKASFKENPDYFHAHDFDGLLCSFLAASIKRTTLIYDSHELWCDLYPFDNIKKIRWLFGPIERILMLKVDYGMTVTEPIAIHLEKRYKKRFLILRNLPTINKNLKARFSLRKQFKKKKIILHLGGTDEGRGGEQMIEAMKYLPKKFILVFIGSRKRHELLNKLITDYKLTGRIHFLPRVLPEEIIETIKEAEIGLALTQPISLHYIYSLPNKLFQYMAANVPILGSNFPEFKKIILKNQIGEVVNPANPKLIAKKIKYMATPSKLKAYRKKIFGLVETKYNWNIESKKLLNFYQEIEKCQK